MRGPGECPVRADRAEDAARGGNVYVLEVNPRASRTVPFLSKVTGVPMVSLATQVMLGQSLAELGYGGFARTVSGRNSRSSR